MLRYAFIMAAGLLLAGCRSLDCAAPEMVASYAPGVKIDAAMSASAWRATPEYRMRCYRNFESLPSKTAKTIGESRYWVDAFARALYDDDNLYIGCRVENDDIRAWDRRDQQRHYRNGDVIEIFLKPAEANGYFELYATPAGNKTTFFYPSRSFSNTTYVDHETLMKGVFVLSRVEGTLNDPSDADHSWSTVMTISRKLLEEKTGIPFSPNHRWTILVAGYSFSKNRIYDTNFSFPLQPRLSYHLQEYYAPLILERRTKKEEAQ